MTEMALQTDFLQTNGGPVMREGDSVVQMDRIPISTGLVRIAFQRGNAEQTCGLALESAKGAIYLSGGERVTLLHIWDEQELPRTVAYRVDCPDGELRVWNIYRTEHASGLVTEDAWTGNAGMIVTQVGKRRRQYRCSCGPGDFDPSNQHVNIDWDDS